MRSTACLSCATAVLLTKIKTAIQNRISISRSPNQTHPYRKQLSFRAKRGIPAPKMYSESAPEKPLLNLKNEQDRELRTENCFLDFLLPYHFNLGIRDRLTPCHAEVSNLAQGKCRHSVIGGRLDPPEISALHIIEHKHRPRIRVGVFNLDALHLQPSHMPHEDTMRRSRAKHCRLRIFLLLLRDRSLRVARGSPARVHDNHIVDLHIFDRMSRNSRHD